MARIWSTVKFTYDNLRGGGLGKQESRKGREESNRAAKLV